MRCRRAVPVIVSAIVLTLQVPAVSIAQGGDHDAKSGTFTALSYNVAGLPEPLSGSDPARNTPKIGRRINEYDLVAVQEDFNYHHELYNADEHPYRTTTSGGVPFGSGLNLLSNLRILDRQRVTWQHCWINQADCLTPKGFTYSRVALAADTTIDVYNLHADAGNHDPDMAARRSNLLQMSRFIGEHSAGRAVLVLGDTNSRYTRGGDILREFVARTGLRDAWVELVRAGVPPEVGAPRPSCDAGSVDRCEVVDKIFFRAGTHVRLSAVDYRNAKARFLDDKDGPLSDHDPIVTRINWARRSHPRTSYPG